MTQLFVILGFLIALPVFAESLSEMGVPQCLESISKLNSSLNKKPISVQKLTLNNKPYYLIRTMPRSENRFLMISENGSWARIFSPGSQTKKDVGQIILENKAVSLDVSDSHVATVSTTPSNINFKEEIPTQTILKEDLKGLMLSSLDQYARRDLEFRKKYYAQGAENSYDSKHLPDRYNEYKNIENGRKFLADINYSAGCEKLFGLSPQDLLCKFANTPEAYYRGLDKQHGKELAEKLRADKEASEATACKNAWASKTPTPGNAQK